jgi:hypothetical protein
VVASTVASVAAGAASVTTTALVAVGAPLVGFSNGVDLIAVGTDDPAGVAGTLDAVEAERSHAEINIENERTTNRIIPNFFDIFFSLPEPLYLRCEP